MFTIIIVSICKHRKLNCCGKSSADSRGDNSKKTFNARKCITAIVLSITFGLSWGFGFVATSHSITSLVVAFQTIFTIVVGFHGVMMFMFHGIRSPEVQALWKSIALSVVKKKVTSFGEIRVTNHTTMIHSLSLKSLSGVKSQFSTVHLSPDGVFETKTGAKAGLEHGDTVE